MKFLGTEVKFHWSILIPFAICAFSPQNLMVLVLCYLVVLAHEFGHVYAGSFFGIKVPTIWLSAIGGAAVSEGDFESPQAEFVTALGGPMVNVFMLALAIPWVSYPLVQTFAIVNTFLLVFNLVPAFPMDGGRLLRATLWCVFGKKQATQICVVISFCLSGVGYGLMLQGYWIIGMVATFITYAAWTEWKEIT